MTQAAQAALLEHCEEAGYLEIGCSDRPPFRSVGLVRSELEEVAEHPDLDEADIDFLEQQAGALVIKTHGSVQVRFFTDEDELEDAWEDVMADLDLDEETEDEETEDEDE